MTALLPSGLLVSALLKRANDAGGMGMVRARGEPNSGAILLILNDNIGHSSIMERALDQLGKPALVATGPADSANVAERESYWRRRRDRDPDLWVIELDIASPERFAAETILAS
ncbi:DUF1491 family protein [Sphingomonas sp. PAMC 26617]|uniref:DUF1491 family protein n=1 Tax=Sphingomonas sp. PAMC 26617 TaxID=1112216 RepID=UPI000495259C|nr:DUF1491 family protein [Sphingomonas sp. PAMC 26617]